MCRNGMKKSLFCIEFFVLRFDLEKRPVNINLTINCYKRKLSRPFSSYFLAYTCKVFCLNLFCFWESYLKEKKFFEVYKFSNCFTGNRERTKIMVNESSSRL